MLFVVTSNAMGAVDVSRAGRAWAFAKRFVGQISFPSYRINELVNVAMTSFPPSGSLANRVRLSHLTPTDLPFLQMHTLERADLHVVQWTCMAFPCAVNEQEGCVDMELMTQQAARRGRKDIVEWLTGFATTL